MTKEYRVKVNNAAQTGEPQVSPITTDEKLFDKWWAKAESFAMNCDLYAVGEYREDGGEWQTLVEFES